MTRPISFKSMAFAPVLGLALTLAACGGAEEETTYEADVTDVSGGELIVTEETPGAVPVTLPETPMTPVPVEGAASTATSTAAAAE